ncbi:MAG: hypothetical protein IPP07_16855 [Holophagales bacterium]|jgi:hypothetical protein|nr:hypothetical protein [Holophagales bacterium]MBK9966464.1 hypothetical protein [Holophagales bacterium]
MPIRVPLEVHAITIVVVEERIEERQIRVGPNTVPRRERVTARREFPPRQDRATFESALRYANAVFAPADIRFHLSSFTPATEEIPNGTEQVDFNGFQYLAGRHPPRSGLSVLLVADFERADLGGQAVESQSTCIVCALGDPGTGKVLAHELGHLLALPHVETGSPRANWNLMYPALRAGDELTAQQISLAQGSRAARRFNAP